MTDLFTTSHGRTFRLVREGNGGGCLKVGSSRYDNDAVSPSLSREEAAILGRALIDAADDRPEPSPVDATVERAESFGLDPARVGALSLAVHLLPDTLVEDQLLVADWLLDTPVVEEEQTKPSAPTEVRDTDDDGDTFTATVDGHVVRLVGPRNDYPATLNSDEALSLADWLGRVLAGNGPQTLDVDNTTFYVRRDDDDRPVDYSGAVYLSRWAVEQLRDLLVGFAS